MTQRKTEGELARCRARRILVAERIDLRTGRFEAGYLPIVSRRDANGVAKYAASRHYFAHLQTFLITSTGMP